MSVRRNGTLTEGTNRANVTYSKNQHFGYVRNKGLNNRWNSVIEYGYSTKYNRYDRECDCNSHRRNHEFGRYERNDRYDRYDRDDYNRQDEHRSSFGSFLEKALPVALGVGAALFGPQIAKFVGGLLGNIFGGSKAPAGNQQNPNSGANNNQNVGGAPASTTPTTVTTPQTNTTPTSTTPTTGTTPPATTPAPTTGTTPPAKNKDIKVKQYDTIFKLIQAEKPELSKEEILKLVDKTINANKTLLDANVQKKPIYADKPAGQYIEIDDALKLILE